jgi:hypothetical protein
VHDLNLLESLNLTIKRVNLLHKYRLILFAVDTHPLQMLGKLDTLVKRKIKRLIKHLLTLPFALVIVVSQDLL